MSTRRRAVPFAGLGLGVAMGLANVMSYVFVALVSSTLGPEDFGGFSALNTYGTLLAMPAGAFQVVIARRQTSADRTDGRHVTGLRSSLGVGLGLAALSIALAPVLRDLLRLESSWAVVFLALMLPPMTVTGALQGVLLGRERYGRLSLIYLVTAATRLGAAGCAVVWQFGVTEVFAAIVVAAIVTTAVALVATGAELDQGGNGPGWTELLDDLVRSNVALAGLMAISSIDVLLARTVLDDHASGAYALAALFGKVVFWGTQFVALTIVPTVAGTGGHTAVRTTLYRSALGVLAIGAVVALVCWLVPGLLVSLSGGTAFTDAEPLLVWTALIGTMWAIIQVWLFAGISQGRHVMTVVVWLGVAVQSVLVLTWLNDSPYEVLTAVGVTATVVALVGLVQVPKGASYPDPGSAENVEALDLTRE